MIRKAFVKGLSWVIRGSMNGGYGQIVLAKALHSPRAMSLQLKIPTLENASYRFANFFLMYFIQGLVPGFFGVCLVNHFIANGFSVSQVGIFTASVAIPWSLQFLWGPVVDKYRTSVMGARRFWQVLAFVACAFVLLTVAIYIPDPLQNVLGLGILLFMHSLFAALMDVSTDALMIANVPDKERGRSTSVGRMGFVFGSALGAIFFASIFKTHGFTASVWVLLGLWLLLGALPVLTLEKESDQLFGGFELSPAKTADSQIQGVGHLLSQLGEAVLTPMALKLCFLFFLVDFSLGAFSVGFNVDLIQKYGWEQEALTRTSGALSLFGGTVVALAIGWFSDRIGHFRALRIFLVLCAGLHFFFAILFVQGWDRSLSPVMLVMQNLVPTFLFIAAAPAIMGLEKTPLAATRFTLIMASMNLGDVAGGAAAGSLLDWIPHAPFSFGISFVFMAGAISLGFSPKASAPLRVQRLHNLKTFVQGTT